MAETVLDSMTQSLRLVPRGVKQAGFYVLGGAAMPAILIEIGFLTNHKEERKLGTPEHREAIARAIYAGLAEYKRRHDQRVRTAPDRCPLTGASGPARASVVLRADGRRPDQLRPVSDHPRLPAPPRGLGARRVRRHQGDLHGLGRGEGAALPQGQGPGLGDRGVRHAAALHQHAHEPRALRAERPLPGDPAPRRPLAARRGRHGEARRAHRLGRLRRDPGRRRHAHRRDHGRLRRRGRRHRRPRQAGRRRRARRCATAWPRSASAWWAAAPSSTSTTRRTPRPRWT